MLQDPFQNASKMIETRILNKIYISCLKTFEDTFQEALQEQANHVCVSYKKITSILFHSRVIYFRASSQERNRHRTTNKIRNIKNRQKEILLQENQISLNFFLLSFILLFFQEFILDYYCYISLFRNKRGDP